jgi:hypothetical protein
MGITRRGLLLAAGATVAGLGAAGSVTAALAAEPTAPKQPGGTPRTLGNLRTVAGSARVDQLDQPITHLGLTWTGDAPRVRLRTAEGWQAWTVPTGCGGGRDDRAARAAVTLPAYGVVGYEITGVDEAEVGEIDVVSGPLRPRDPAARELTTMANRPLHCRYRNRAAWGADESLRFNPDGTNKFPDAYFPVQTLTVHHTAIDVGEDPADQVRAIYYDHTITRNFGDIGYHLLIDGNGTVYEGRSSGADGVPVFGGTPQRPPHMNNAAHVGGFNAGNVGVCLLGDFTSAPPTEAAQDTLVQVLAILSAVCDLDPLGRTDYVNPISGSTRQVNTISGHRDWAATECPGNQLYPLLPELRQRVADRARTPEIRAS